MVSRTQGPNQGKHEGYTPEPKPPLALAWRGGVEGGSDVCSRGPQRPFPGTSAPSGVYLCSNVSQMIRDSKVPPGPHFSFTLTGAVDQEG